jgi:hypothetical protein
MQWPSDSAQAQMLRQQYQLYSQQAWQQYAHSYGYVSTDPAQAMQYAQWQQHAAMQAMAHASGGAHAHTSDESNAAGTPQGKKVQALIRERGIVG